MAVLELTREQAAQRFDELGDLTQTLGVRTGPESWIYLTFERALGMLLDRVEGALEEVKSPSDLLVHVTDMFNADRAAVPIRIDTTPYRESPTTLLLVDLDAGELRACHPADAPEAFQTWPLADIPDEACEIFMPGHREAAELMG